MALEAILAHMSEKEDRDLVSNRKARHLYEILETFEAGMVLQGTEIKSLRDHGGALQDAYVRVDDDAPYLVNASIAPYKFGNLNNHEERRERKLLMHKREMRTLRNAIQEKGLTVVPLGIYLNKRGKAKVKIAVARGKKSVDKREAIKERDEKRHMQRVIRNQRDDS